MKIGCLQFAPQVGDVDNNLNRADSVLSRSNPEGLDLLVLPELAFTGYNFKSLQHISPYLEPTTAGITSLWARTTALKHNCVVIVGYPEKVDISQRWPASPEYYNSAITVNADGETIANYRKSFLYYTDETWALEGPDGFFDGEIDGLGNVVMGLNMDLNPYKFEAPWSAWEFAYHILHKQANLAIISMCWLTREDLRSYSRQPKEPDMKTLAYWLARLEPVIRVETEDEIIVVLCNRCGSEDETVYAGTSAVLGIQAGEVKVYGILGRGEKELLVADTEAPPKAKLICVPNPVASDTPPNSKKQAALVSNQSITAISGNPFISIDAALSSMSTQPTNSSQGQRAPISKNNHELGDERNISEDDIVSPLSPVNAGSPSVFFGTRIGDGQALREGLKSSTEDKQELVPVRPASPKSRNASRTRTLEPRDLLRERKTSTSTSTTQPRQRSSSRTRQAKRQVLHEDLKPLSRPSSRSTNRTKKPGSQELVTGTQLAFQPALPDAQNTSRNQRFENERSPRLSHENSKEPLTDLKAPVAMPPLPSTAAALPEQSKFPLPENGFGKRTVNLPTRPKSVNW